MTERKNLAAITFMFSVRLVSRFAVGIDIHVANRISVSFRIEGMSLVVFAISHLLQSLELSDRFRGRDCECSHIALNSE